MNITPQQVLEKIRGIEDAICAGLKTGNIKTDEGAKMGTGKASACSRDHAYTK
jgi:hypothetical protein